MNCPKCKRTMEKGYLQTGNIIAFNKKRHKISLNSKDPEDVMVARKTFLSNDFSGNICKECGLICFDYLNPKARL